MVKISVIIPVYNVEKYLEKTLDSILNQTMIDDLEVLMIDDGSTDYSRQIIYEYAQKYDNFHAYYKKHDGPGIARNYGLQLAKGEYIHFMDADDYLPPKAYENLYNFNHDNDFIIGNILKFGEYNIWENILFKKAFKDFDCDIKSFRLDDYPNVLWDTITCNKLYKKEFLDRYRLRFIDKNSYYEDILFSIQTYILADSIGFSRNIFYFWRLREDKSSITQKQDDVKNFVDRLEILKIYDSLMSKYNLNADLKNYVYSKWLNHDLKTSLKKLRNYPGDCYMMLLDGTNEILDIIPREVKDNLNFYLKIIYRMVENYDIKSLLQFAHLEDDLKQDPNMELDLPDEYMQLLDLSCGDEDSVFEAHVSDVFNDDKYLYLEFLHNLEFSPIECPHESVISLINGSDSFPLEVQNNIIIIPLELVKDKTHLKIRISYETDSFGRVTLLKNYSRQSIRYSNYDIDVGIGINNILYLDVKRKTDNRIVINDIIQDDDVFIFKGESLKQVKNIILTNYVTYRQFRYPVKYGDDLRSFIFAVPYHDLSNNIINKWELNCEDSFNSIELSKKFKFTYHNFILTFMNKRNKIFISNNTIDRDLEDVGSLILKNQMLASENKRLADENLRLNKKVDEFKSRKVIKFTDSFRKIFR